MGVTHVVQIGRDLLYTAMLLSLPTLAVSLVVGLLVSIFQALTSIQEQTLSYAPRLAAVAVVCVVTMPWSLKILMQFSVRMLMLAAEMVR